MLSCRSGFALLALLALAARGDDFGFDEEAPAAPADPWAGVTQLFPDTRHSSSVTRHSSLPSLELVGEYDLPDTAPEGLSSIAWRGNTPGLETAWSDLYALVEDSGGRLHSAAIGIDRATGAITNAVVSPAGAIPGAADLEGVACGACPVADETMPMLFASDESGPAVWAKAAFDTSGPDWNAIRLPEAFRHCRPNLALEALALSADGRILWTANEGPLPEDGPEPTTKHGARIRLYGLPVCSFLPVPGFASSKQAPPAEQAEPAFRFYELDPATGTSLPHLPAPFNGLAELCALPDGRLLALERSYGFRTRGDSDPRGSLIAISIYLVDPLHAEPAGGGSGEAQPPPVESHAEFAESTELESHAESAEPAEPGGASSPSEPLPSDARTAAAARPPVLAKTLIWRGLTGRSNYEGMTLGPELADGSRVLLLVADGDVTRKRRFSFPWRKALLSFRFRLP
jgi:hypothetical protein